MRDNTTAPWTSGPDTHEIAQFLRPCTDLRCTTLISPASQCDGCHKDFCAPHLKSRGDLQFCGPCAIEDAAEIKLADEAIQCAGCDLWLQPNRAVMFGKLRVCGTCAVLAGVLGKLEAA